MPSRPPQWGAASGLGEIIEKAHHLVAERDLGRAQRLLADALAGVDLHSANASPEMVEAAALQARVLVALGEPHSARVWAAAASAAATRLYGRADERSVSAAVTLAAVLHRVGADARAARLYSEVILELTARDGPESHRALAAHADLSTVEYARSQCDVARDRLQNTWELHRKVYGEGHPSGIKMLAKLGAMERDCGRWAEAHEHLTLAKQLCRRHLPDDNPLARQVTGLAQAIGDLEHTCGEPTSPNQDTPTVPVTRLPEVVEGPVEPRLPELPIYHPTDRTGSGSSNRQDAPHTRPEATGIPLDDDRRPPDELFGEAWRPAETASPGAVVGLTDCVQADVPGVPCAVEARTSSDRLPAPAPSSPVETRAAQWLLLAAGIVALLLGTTAVVATISAPDFQGSEPTITGAPSRASAPAATPSPTPAGPPDQVWLTDRRDSIVLHWRYPADAEGPVVIAGGRSGQEQRTFTELPAGADSYTAYGLSRSNDYCFTIAVVWSTDTVARADPVCTHRGRPSAARPRNPPSDSPYAVVRTTAHIRTPPHPSSHYPGSYTCLYPRAVTGLIWPLRTSALTTSARCAPTPASPTPTNASAPAALRCGTSAPSTAPPCICRASTLCGLRTLAQFGEIYRDCGRHDLAPRSITGTARYLPVGAPLYAAEPAACTARPPGNPAARAGHRLRALANRTDPTTYYHGSPLCVSEPPAGKTRTTSPR